MAMGAVIGGLTGKMRDYGIDDRFIDEVKSKVTEGTSALFLLTNNAVADLTKGADTPAPARNGKWRVRK